MEIQKYPIRKHAYISYIRLQSDLDASNYQDLLSNIFTLHQLGVSQVVLELSHVGFASGAGLLGLYQSLLIINGIQLQKNEDGWSALHAISKENRTFQKNITLIGLQPAVQKSLEMAGLKDYFEVYPSLQIYALNNESGQREMRNRTTRSTSTLQASAVVDKRINQAVT